MFSHYILLKLTGKEILLLKHVSMPQKIGTFRKINSVKMNFSTQHIQTFLLIQRKNLRGVKRKLHFRSSLVSTLVVSCWHLFGCITFLNFWSTAQFLCYWISIQFWSKRAYFGRYCVKNIWLEWASRFLILNFGHYLILFQIWH